MRRTLTLCLLSLLITSLALAKPQQGQPRSAEHHGGLKPGIPPINPHGAPGDDPNVVIEQDGRVRVDTKTGPVWIRQCEPVRSPAMGGSVSPGGSPAGIGPDQIPYPACLLCHDSIENATENMMGMNLDCTFCHGGDPYAVSKAVAHVHSDGSVIYDTRVPPLDRDLEYQRFVNPSNLRVLDGLICDLCHPIQTRSVKHSMMATNAGHIAGGFYLNDVVDTKTPIYGTFAIMDDDGVTPFSEGAVLKLMDMKIFDPLADPTLFSSHYAAVPSQACARCHLWSRGKGYRGALGQAGVYRADGCAACHLLYANDGLSHSADTNISHTEPGHPMVHTITRQVPTEQCLHCHHRGARIGLSFTGRAQMPPRLPSGPGVAGTTDELFNGNYHYTVADTNPQDIHGELGMHCIDCHTSRGIMGDGNLWGHMDQATKIECRTCHGLPASPPDGLDNDGYPLNNFDYLPGQGYILTSKLDGSQHPIPTVESIVDPLSPRYNATAAASMNSDHLKVDGGLECYACHSAWVPNCFGCHFERDEQQLGLNLMTNMYEQGKVSTNNKIFEALRHFTIGPNSEGRVAPYLVSCMPIADVTAPNGSKLLDFAMPVTSNGLSGLAHNPVQPHTVRSVGEVRTCVECHRSPVTLGLGSGNYAIARTRVITAGPSGSSQFDRQANPSQPVPGSTLSGPALGLASLPNVVEGTTDYLFVAQGSSGVAVYDGTSGTLIGPVHTIAGINAIDVARAARYLYVVDQGVGLRIYDNQTPTTTSLVATVSIPSALRVVPWGIHLFVTAGASGLAIIDISDHATPSIVRWVTGMNAQDVEVYSHFQAGSDFAARAYVADPAYGVRIVDLLPDLDNAQLVSGIPLAGASGLDCYTRWVAAAGSEPPREHDYLYVAAGGTGLRIYDITDPDGPVLAATVTSLGGALADVSVSSALAPPGVDDYAYLANSTLGLQVLDLNDPTNPQVLGTVPGSPAATRVFTEVQALDRYLDEQGSQLKENSHPFVTTFTRGDIVRLLSVTIP